MEKVNVENVVK